MCVCVCAFPPTKVRSVSVWPPRRTPARDTGARSKAFSSCSAALLYLCSTGGCRPGVPSAVLARVSTQEPGRSLAFEAAPLPPRGQRLDKTRNLTPRHLPLSEGLSSPGPMPRYPPPPRRRDPQRARPSRRRTERPMRSRARQVPRGSVREFGWRLRSHLRALSSQPPRAPVADPRFFPSPCSPRCVPPERRGGGGGGTAQHAFSTLCQFFVKAGLEELGEELRFGCIVPRHWGAFFWETKRENQSTSTSEK